MILLEVRWCFIIIVFLVYKFSGSYWDFKGNGGVFKFIQQDWGDFYWGEGLGGGELCILTSSMRHSDLNYVL